MIRSIVAIVIERKVARSISSISDRTVAIARPAGVRPPASRCAPAAGVLSSHQRITSPSVSRRALAANRVFLRVAESNIRSWRIPERLGFVHEGTVANEIRDAEGTLHAIRYYGMTPEQWRTLR